MRHLVSFADSRMHRSLNRIKRQAESFNIFQGIHLYNETNLPLEFRAHHKNNLIPGSRGYGYWCWKPQVIKIALNNLNEGELLLYIDAGCHLNINGKTRLKEYFEKLANSPNGVIAFQANEPNQSNSTLKHDGRALYDQPNYKWIKGDAFKHFGVQNDKSFTDAQAIGAGIILIRKCKDSTKIIEEWLNIANEHFNLLDDSPSKSGNIDGFIEHRHDQAIWTLLCLKYKVPTLCAFEYWYPKNSKSDRLAPDWVALRDFPIHAKRDKDLGLLLNVKLKAQRFFSHISARARCIFS